jgi:hypothetical protein
MNLIAIKEQFLTPEVRDAWTTFAGADDGTLGLHRSVVGVLFLLLTFVIALNRGAYGAEGNAGSSILPEVRAETSLRQANAMKIRLTVNGNAITATLIDRETTRDFVSLLPLTLTMNDLFGREKFGDLPRPISEKGKRTRTYEVGDVIYWSPSAHLAIYYHHDEQSIPSPGIIIIDKIDSGVEALNVPGSVKVTIERVGNQQ